MDKKYIKDFAVVADGRCDLNGLPCLQAINLARQMARVSASLDQTLPESFSVDNGLMTPTLKLRRHLIVKANQSLLDSLY